MADQLPEGTDHIVPGASATTPDRGSDDAAATGAANDAADQVRATAADVRDKAQSKAEELRGQAADAARDYAEQGKARAAGGLDEVARMLGDNATQIDEKLGAHYGDYARRAADAVSGVADQIRDKDVEELLDDARALVRRAPGAALGVAATAGFVLARIIRSGSESLEAASAARDGSR